MVTKCVASTIYIENKNELVWSNKNKQIQKK